MINSRLIYYINPSDKHPTSSLAKLIKARIPSNVQPIILCIGSDRLTGDCLGPIIGTRLCRMLSDKIKVYGTLQSPVHALNLNSVTQAIEERFASPYIIAVDACLGTHIGCVALSEGGLVPGAGVNKTLTPSSIGQLSITGIVGSCHGNTLNTLSTVRLNSVVELAEIISEAIVKSLSP